MTTNSGEFEFLDPGSLAHGDLELVLSSTSIGDEEMNGCPCYLFEMRSVPGGEVMGNLRFRVGDEKAELQYLGHIGYDVEPGFRGNRYAARSVRLILDFASRHGLARIWINCDSQNIASCRTCEAAGAVYHDTVNPPAEDITFRDGIREMRRYYLQV